MFKAFFVSAAMLVAAAGIQHALAKLSADADAPLMAIAKAQAAKPFGWQPPAAQVSAIMQTNAVTIASDRAALAKAEQQATP
jgi:hypothetical protein